MVIERESTEKHSYHIWNNQLRVSGGNKAIKKSSKSVLTVKCKDKLSTKWDKSPLNFQLLTNKKCLTITWHLRDSLGTFSIGTSAAYKTEREEGARVICRVKTHKGNNLWAKVLCFCLQNKQHHQSTKHWTLCMTVWPAAFLKISGSTVAKNIPSNERLHSWFVL